MDFIALGEDMTPSEVEPWMVGLQSPVSSTDTSDIRMLLHGVWPAKRDSFAGLSSFKMMQILEEDWRQYAADEGVDVNSMLMFTESCVSLNIVVLGNDPEPVRQFLEGYSMPIMGVPTDSGWTPFQPMHRVSRAVEMYEISWADIVANISEAAGRDEEFDFDNACLCDEPEWTERERRE